MEQNAIPVLAVVGPTASGKTALAVEIALAKNGEVVSADSMQIYRGMRIGTAKPAAQEMRGVPHYLMDFLDVSEPFSVAQYVTLAKECIAGIHARGRLPIVAGGTGLYVRSLLSNVQFSEEERDEELRNELAQKAEAEGGEALLRELASFDPESAARMHPNNVGRIIRAIEIYRTTGITMTEQLKRSKLQPSPYNVCMIGLDFANRQTLYDRINRRVDAMMEQGLLEEARQVLSSENARTAIQAIGYKELAPYFSGEIGLEEAVENLKRETRRYAKRQLTWFRREENIHWIYIDQCSSWQEVLQKANSIMEIHGL